MKFKAQEIASLLGGVVDGDPSVEVNSLSKIEEGTKGSLSFLANPKYEEHLYHTGASVVIVDEQFKAEKPLPETCSLIRVNNAYEAFSRLLTLYDTFRHGAPGIHPSAVIDETAQLDEDVMIGAQVYIGKNVLIGAQAKIYAGCVLLDNVKIGANTVLMPGVKVMHSCQIGSNCILQPNVVIGGDGFGFAPSNTEGYAKVPQIGNVVVEDMVEIGANTTIDRATLGSTIIRKGVKLDNLIQVAHNVEIGEHTVIAAQTGIAGSTKIGARCMIGGQVGIIGHLQIADEVKIAAQSGIGNNVPEPGTILQGSPAFDVGRYKRAYASFRNLPDLQKEITEIKNLLNDLKSTRE